MDVKIYPSKPEGVVFAPPSKSMAHRLLICAGLSSGKSVVSNIAFSDDVKATINCLKSLGAEIEVSDDTVKVIGIDTSNIFSDEVLDCNECGSTLRFFIPICLLGNKEIRLTGSSRLLERPQSVYEYICRDKKLMFERCNDYITVKGPLKSGDYYVDGGISSQFISGLIFALSCLENDSRIHIKTKTESRPYIDLTLSAVRKFGVNVVFEDDQTIFIPGKDKFISSDSIVEGDWSNAAFFALLAKYGDVQLKGTDDNSLQGDKVCIGHIDNIFKGNCVIDLSDCPDLGPVLFTAAAMNKGAVFTGTQRLKIKESDRVAAMAEELSKCGIEVADYGNKVTVSGGYSVPEKSLDGHNDHRIAMSLSILLTQTGGVITGAGCVSKSMPDYFEKLSSLGVRTEVL